MPKIFMFMTNGLVKKGIPLKRVIYLIALLCWLCSSLAHATLLSFNPETVEAEAWTVLDPQSGQVIAEHNSQIQRAPASLTKMMVAYIVLKDIQAGKLNAADVLTATPVVKQVMWDESQMYLKEGEQISVDQLLAGLIVMSANDAALTLAERISGSVPQFVARMNQEAQALGMQHTHFQNPAGITMPEHYSTAADLARLAQAVVNDTPDYLAYSKQTSFTYNQRYHRATNILLKQDLTVDGLKTGYTRAAGYNLALTANRLTQNFDDPNRRLIVVVLGAKSAFKRAEIAQQLMNISYAYTRNEVALKNKQLIAELPVVKSTLKMFKVEVQQPKIVTTSLYGENSAINLKQFDVTQQRLFVNDTFGQTRLIEPLTQTETHLNVELKEKLLTAPLAQVMQLATVHVYQNNRLINTIHLEEEVHIAEASLFEKLLIWLKSLFSFSSKDETAAKTYPLV